MVEYQETLIKNYAVDSKNSSDRIRRTSGMEFHLLKYRKNIEVIQFYQIWKLFCLNKEHYLIKLTVM